MRVFYELYAQDRVSLLESHQVGSDSVPRKGDLVEFERNYGDVFGVVWSCYGSRVHVRCETK